MTTTYKGKAAFTKLGVAYVPASVVVSAEDAAGNLLVNAATPTAGTNFTNVYRHSYSGADGLDIVWKFYTTDVTVDSQTIYDYTPDILTTNLTGTIASILARLPAALTSNGNMKSSLLEIITTALSEGATGRISAAWQAFWNVTSPVATAQNVNQTGDAFARLGAPAGASVSADIAAVDTDVWAYATRTLTQSAASVAAIVDGTSITVKRGDTWVISLTSLGSLVNMSKLYFCAKNQDVADVLAPLWVGYPAGLLSIYPSGSNGVTAGNAAIVIDDANLGNITITIAAVEAAKLTIGSYSYDVQIVRSVGVPVSTLTAGNFTVAQDVTLAVS